MNLRQYNRLDRSLGTNKFIYFLSKIPLIGSSFDSTLYGDVKMKQMANIFTTIVKVLMFVLKQSFTIVFYFQLVPYLLMYELTLNLPPLIRNNLFYFSILIYLMVYANSKLISPISKKDKPNKWILAKNFSVSYKAIYFIYFKMELLKILVLVITLLLLPFKLSMTVKILASVYLIAVFLLGECLDYLLYKRFAKGSHWKRGFLIFFLLLPLYVGLYFTSFFTSNLVLPSAGVLFLVGVLSAFIVRSRMDFELLGAYYASKLQLSNDALIRNSELLNDGLRVDEKDFDLEKSEKIAQRYTGYAYINRILLMRHRKVWLRPLIFKSALLAIILTTITVVAIVKAPFNSYPLNFMFEQLTPYIIGMYFILAGESLVRCYFLSCDYSLLHYPFYKRRETILQQFGVRLFSIVKINLVLTGIVALFMFLWMAMGLTRFGMDIVMPFILSLVLITVFFSLHPLFLYYMTQPFDKDLRAKGVVYTALNIGIYFFAYSSDDIFTGPNSNLYITLFVFFYIGLALFLVWKYSHITFKIRE